MIGSRAVFAASLIACAAALVSCQGHGKYTSELKQDALTRQDAIRSATEWDAANQAYASGNLELALDHVRQSIEFKGDVAKAHLLAARIYLELGDAENTLASIDRGLSIEETSGLYYLRGIQLERTGDVRGAQASFSRAFELDQTSLIALMASAESLVDLGLVQRARAELLSNVDRFGYSAGLQQSLGHIALLDDDLDSASRHFREASVLDPESASIEEDLARISIATRRFAEAEFTLARLLERPSHKARRDLKHMHARTLIELDRPVEARSILRELTRSDRGASDESAWSMMVDVALMLGDEYMLDDASRKLVQIAPDRREGHLARAVYLHRVGRSDEALAVLSNLGDRLGDTNESVTQLERVIRHEMAASAGR